MVSNDLISKINDINRKLGSKVIWRGDELSPPERIPTGSLSLDHALRGGWPSGRFVLIWGNRSSGKSTLSLRTIAEAQKMGKRCMYIDAEKACDPSWAEKNGIDISSLLVIRKNGLTEILEATEKLLKESLIDVIVLDSINAINSSKFFDGDNNSIGQNARSVGELMAKWNAWNNDALVIFISQVRNKFAANMVYSDHGGGLAAEHYPSVIVKILSSRDKNSFIYERVENSGRLIDRKVGQLVKWEITKSKVSTPHLTGQFPLYSDARRDDTYELLDLGISLGVINKSGAWLSVDDMKFQGEAALREHLRKDEKLFSTLKDRVMAVESVEEATEED